ncbi:MAG: 4Fe-4S dicluster domain-containing protein [Chlorobiaceae bacterium]|nr:4Fe-4S dicluster domain-containing protein [Chlorobiaceae bacterium]
MLDFEINTQSCTRCGDCVSDCPARIIFMHENGFPYIPVEKEANCYRCQHCLAVCPEGSISIHGIKPSESLSLEQGFPDPAKLELLMKGRRSVRRFQEEPLEPGLLRRLLEVAWHAPTGVNSRQVLFTVLDSREKVAEFREAVMKGLADTVAKNALPKGREFYGGFLKLWQEKKVDILFRNAPHLLVASAPATVSTPVPDCLIALSYFELFAQANGVGTLWNGLAKWTIDDLLPETRECLGIPADHVVGYVMTFGKPAVHYCRTVQHGPALINHALTK